MSEKKSMAREYEERLMRWVGYWRNNPHRFVEEYLGMNLKLYQKILMYMMDKSQWFMYIASRGQGKSYIIAIYSITRCILYPNTNVIIGAGTKGQAGLIITEKIVSMYNNYPVIRAEIGDIKNIRTSVNKISVHFLNGSKIEAVANADTSRGFRGNILIMDEFRMMDKDTVDSVFKPMLTVVRQPPFMALPKYRGYPKEGNKQIYLSSAWYQSHWSWGEFKRFVHGYLDGRDLFAVTLPWQVAHKHGLLQMSQISEERNSETFDSTKFQMEYDGVFPSENESAWFKLDKILNARVLKRVFRPPTNEEYLINKEKSRTNQKNLSNMPRKEFDTEKRIIALDIALLGSSRKAKNDSSAFTCMRLKQDGESYIREVVYMESITDSIESKALAIRLKQLYYDFEADYVVVDTMGQGIGVFDALAGILYDEERDEEYEPWISMNDESMNERIKAKGKPIIYSFKANQKLNNDIAIQLRASIEKGRLLLPIDEIIKREQLVADGGFLKLSPEEKQRELKVFLTTTALQHELVALEHEIVGGNIKMKEVGTATKDRYSSIAYCNWYANELEVQLKSDEETDWDDFFFVSGGLGR